MSKYVHGWIRVGYWILTALFFAIGCFILASIEESAVERYGIRTIDFVKRPLFQNNITVKVDEVERLREEVKLLRDEVGRLQKQAVRRRK